jgi:diguanylate cyclase (GGDEF)-like protein/PAS domain S-box-containing protein
MNPEVVPTQTDGDTILPGAEKYRALFEQVHDAIYITSRDGRFIDINRSALELFGYTRAEMLGLNASAIYVNERDRAHFQTVVEEVDFVRDYEVELRRRDGTIIHALLSSTVRRDHLGQVVGYHGIIHDITRRKEAEQALRESEERYALAVRGANDGIWDWDIPANTIYVSPRWRAMVGLPEDDAIMAPEYWLERVHPDDREAMIAEIQAHLRGEVPLLEHEYRVLHENGHYLWVLSRGLTVRDYTGAAYRMAGSLTDITSRKVAEERLLHGAFHDTLTGLANRALFMDRLGRLVERGRRRTDDLFALLFLDLDRFKLINDRHGHLVGDQLLTGIARRLENCIRPGDTAARLGGDEFAILLADVEHLGDATRVADRILRELELPFPVGEQHVSTTASIGITVSSSGYERPDDVLRDADIALYRAKALGRGRHKVFDLAIHAQTIARLELETDLSQAIGNGELQLLFQPVIALDTGKITGFEALLRWDHPAQGILLPKDFIAIAEDTGLIISIGAWVLRKACRQLQQWLQSYPNEAGLDIHINLSGKQFAHPSLVADIRAILHETAIAPGYLTIELSESVLMEDAETAIEICRRLKALGLRLCIDDFGTGYSSLSYLHHFPTDALKIDRSFITRIGANDQNLELVRTIVTLARNLGMATIAEGIETPEQLTHLRALGCRIGQGYLFEGPITAAAAEGMLEIGDVTRVWR